MPNWKKVLVSGSAANLSSLSVDTSITASIISGSEITGSLFGTASQAVSSSYALTASYALSSPAGVGSSVIYTQDTPSTTWVFAHNLGGSYVTMNVYDGNNNIIIPQNITATGPNTLTLTFSIPTSGHAVATVGGGLPGISAIVSNYVLAVNQDGTAATWVSASGLSVTSASYATSASYSSTSEWLGLNGNPISASYGIAAVSSTTVIASANTGSYYAAFFDYAAVSGSNSRAGTVMSTWNGASTVYNDVTTNDIGNTSQVTMSVDLSGASVRLNATTTTQWTIRSLVRLV